MCGGRSSAATATSPSMWSGHPGREQPSKSGSQNRPERPTGTFRAVYSQREPEVRKRRNREPIVSQNRSWRLPVGRTCRTCWRLGYTVTRIAATTPPRRWTACGSRTAAPGIATPREWAGMPSPSYSILRQKFPGGGGGSAGIPRPRQGRPAERSRQTEQAPEPPKPFALPPRHTDARRVYAYLKSAGFLPDYSEFYFRRTAV